MRSEIIDCQFMERSIGKPITTVNRFAYGFAHENSCMEEHKNPLTFGERVRESRKAIKGMTQTKLAKAVGMAQATLSEIERGDYESSTYTPQIASKLGVSALWLAQGKGLSNEQTEEASEPEEESRTEEVQRQDESELPRGALRIDYALRSVRAVLEAMGFSADQLGTSDDLRAALAAKEPLERYSLTEIEETLRGLHQDKPAAFRNAHPDELFGALAGKLSGKHGRTIEAEKSPSNVHHLPTKE